MLSKALILLVFSRALVISVPLGGNSDYSNDGPSISSSLLVDDLSTVISSTTSDLDSSLSHIVDSNPAPAGSDTAPITSDISSSTSSPAGSESSIVVLPTQSLIDLTVEPSSNASSPHTTGTMSADNSQTAPASTATASAATGGSVGTNSTGLAAPNSTNLHGSYPTSNGSTVNSTGLPSQSSVDLDHVIASNSSTIASGATEAVALPPTRAIHFPTFPIFSFSLPVFTTSTSDVSKIASQTVTTNISSQTTDIGKSSSSVTPQPTSSTVSIPSATPSSRSCPFPDRKAHPLSYYTLADVDACQFPALNKYPVLAWPLDSGGEPKQEPGLALWFALSMDEWLEDLFSACPAALDTRTDDSDGEKREPFSRVLGRLMFGQKDGAFSAITCNQNRCAWNAEKGWCRGDMFASESSPCMGLSTCPPGQDKTDLEFIEKVRRWYALQALGNVWDHKKAVAAAMIPASQAVSGRMEQFMNDWSPTFVAGHLEPPKSPFSAIFDIFKSVASFIPVAGPAVSSALSAADAIFPITDPNKMVKPAKSDVQALADAARLKAVKDAIAVQAKGIVGAVTTVLEVNGDIQDALSKGRWVPDRWDPLFPIGAADMKGKFSGVFARMVGAMGKLFDDSINGPPRGPNGFLTLVKGGLYSTSSMNPDVMHEDSLEKLIPTYVAYTEDKLLQAIMHSYGVFFLTHQYLSQADCEAERQKQHADWVGSLCFPTKTGRWRALTPYTTNFGSEEVMYEDNNNNRHTLKQNLHQIWPHLTAANVGKLRGDLSRTDHPTDIVSLYQQLGECFEHTNDRIYHRPSVGGSSTGYKNFPDAVPTTSQSPLDSICHWNLPVVDPYPWVPDDQPFAWITCTDEYRQGDRAWTFRTDIYGSMFDGKAWKYSFRGPPTLDTKGYGWCKMRENGWVENHSCCCGYDLDNCPGGWSGFNYYGYGPRPGPALYYARALAYPAHPDCVLNSFHVNCEPI